jgi:response regulator RpfG family c-di-GMP phosphodiesterase
MVGSQGSRLSGGRLRSGAVFECLVRAGRFRDVETAEHVERVSRTCALIGRALSLGTVERANLRIASAMHDIGKTSLTWYCVSRNRLIPTSGR